MAEVNQDPPRFTLMDVTTAMGDSLKLLTPAERLAGERQVNVVMQGIIDRLKALPVPRRPVLTADENAALHGFSDAYAGPND